MKRIFASAIWTRVILVLAILFIVWSITLIVSVKQRQADLAYEVGLINKLNGVAQSIFALDKSLNAAGPNDATRWRTLYNDYRSRRAEFDPGDPNFRDLQVNLIRTDSLLIRLDRLHTDFRQAAADQVLQKSMEADFHREINAATTEVQSAVQTIQARTGQISVLLAEKWNTLFVLMLVACGLAVVVTLLVRLLQKEMAKIKEADAALRQSEDRLRKTFEHAPIGIVTSTPDGKFIQLNQAFCELVGYTELELVRLSLADISHPDDFPAHEGLMNRLLNREISHYQMEKRYRTKKGQIVYTLLQGNLVRDVDGTPLHFIEQIVDMTERIMAEIGRRQSDERFRELAENIQEVFWLTDPAKNEMLYVSPAYEKIWGRTCRSLYDSPQSWFEAIHPDDRERVHRAALTKQVIGQYDETYRILFPDGESRWIRDRAFPIRDELGSVYRLAGLAEDITERKNFNATLQESEQRWNFALEGSDAGVWDWDTQTNRVFYSKRWKEMLGYQDHEVGDSLDESYSRIHAEDLKAAVGALEKHLRGEVPVYISEHRVRCKGGSYKWILDRGKVITRTPEAKPWRVVGTHTDMTERKEAAEELNVTYSRLTTFIENLQSGILFEDKERRVAYMNQMFCDMFGIPVAPSAGAGMDCRLVAEQSKNLFMEKEEFVPRVEEILAARMLVTNEELRLHDGRVFERDYIPIFAGQEYLGHLWHYRDITAIKQAAAETRKSEEQFRLTFEMAPIGMTISGVDGVFQRCNRAFCEMLGYAPEELQDKTWVEVTHPNDVSTNIAFRERLLRGELPNFQMQKRYLAKDGRAVHALLQMTLIKGEQGRPLHFISQSVNLTALKQTQEELSKQSAILQSIVDSMADGVVVADMNGKFLLFNPAAERIIGLGATETAPQDWADKYGLYWADQITHFPIAQNPMARAMQGETAPAVEMFVRNPQRPRGVWVSVTGTPLREESGASIGGVVVFRDVTVQKQAEDLLRKNEEQFRLTFEHAPIGMAISSIDGAILQVNQAYCDILGRTSEELINRSVMEFTHPEDSTENRDLTRQLLRGEILHYQMEKRYLAKDGHTVYAILTASVVRDRDGHPLHFIGQIADITERKAAEEEVRKLNAELEQRVIARTKELQESEERFRQLAENIDEIFWVDSADLQQTLYISPAYEKIWGRSRDTIYERAEAWIDDIHPEDRERICTAFNNLHAETYDVEFRMLRPDSTMRWIRDRAFPVRNESGEVLRVVGISEDITQRKLAAEALRQSEERFRALYDDNPSIYFMVDANGVILSANQFGAEELGYDAEELVGEPITKIFAEEDWTKARQHVNTCLKSPDRSFTWELRMLRKNNNKLWVREYSRAAQDNAGNPVVYIVCEDITSRRQAELMLQGSEARLRKQNESLSDLVCGKTFQSGNLQVALQAVTETSAQCLEIERVSVWFYDEARTKIICRDLFEWSRNQHAAGVELMQKDYLPYFEALSEGRDIDAHDAQNDYRTRCFRDSYLRPLGITSMLDAPIRLRGELVGVVCHEHVGIQRQWTLDEQVFVGSLADLVAQALEAHERRRVEQALRDSEERYRTLVEQMPDGIYRSTPDGRFVEVNPAMYQMFGYASKEEFLALDIPTQLYFSPDECNGAIQNLKQIGSEGITITRHRHKDGHEMWMEDHGRFIYDDRGSILYNEGILRDITARKKAEETLLANEKRLRRQNESLRDLVSSKAFQGGELPEVYREITDTVARSMNVERVSIWFYDDARSKIVCQNLYELSGERHSQGVEFFRKDFLPYFEALAEARGIDAHEAQTDYRTRCFAESYLKPLGITSMLDAPIRAGGNVIGLVCCEQVGPARRWTLDEEVYANSIADLAALAIESHQLQESETRFRTLIETMNDGLVQLDEKGLLVYVNDKMCEMTGFSREQLLGREVLPRLDAESRDILHEQIERRQTGESKPYEMEVRKTGGGKLPALISPRPIFGFDGRFSGSFAVVTDISERKRMEEQIRRHAEELEQLVEERAKRIRVLEQQRSESEKLAATGRMSARIAHEINNPLAGIKNSFLLVKDGIPTTHRYYDYVRRIETEIERIARIVRQMFDLYRPQQESVRNFPADIAIRDVVALLRSNCRERDVNIDVDINAPMLNVALSESSLRQVLYNVIQNAVDASAPGSTVRVRAVSEQQKLTINVIDQGQGIPDDIRTKIFEPFFTTKSGLERSGLGLGLSVSKGLVEAMGGKLDFESTVGKGTTFAIVLPLDGAAGKQRNSDATR